MKIFHHNDADGKCAGFWASFDRHDGSCDFIEMAYGKPFSFDQITPNEKIWIVDYSIEPSEMERLLSITPNVYWIDHHKTAIEKYKDFPQKIKGLRLDGISGCELAYLYVWNLLVDQDGDERPEEFWKNKQSEIPLSTRLIGDRDVWKFQYGDDTKFFDLGLQTQDTTPESPIWARLSGTGGDEVVKQLIEVGKHVEKYKTNWAANYATSFGYPVEFEGYHCFAMNLGQCGSEFFKSIEADDYDILIAYGYDGKIEQWRVSLYTTKTDKIDVSVLAKKYKGGGHRGAAGFQTIQPPMTYLWVPWGEGSKVVLD